MQMRTIYYTYPAEMKGLSVHTCTRIVSFLSALCSNELLHRLDRFFDEGKGAVAEQEAGIAAEVGSKVRCRIGIILEGLILSSP